MTPTRHAPKAEVTAGSQAADDLTNHALKSRAAALSIASNSVLIVFKLVVGLLSGSIAIISEALHSGSDLIAAIIAFWSVRRAAEPPDERHHYGHEKVENLSGVIEATLIIAAAAVIIVEGVHKLIDGVHIDHVWLGIAVMAVSGVVNLIMSKRVLYPVARRTQSAALEADAAHLLTDVYTSFGVAGGLLLVQVTGIEIIDPIAAIAVATLIMRTGWQLVVGSTKVLLDETLEPDELELDPRAACAATRATSSRATTGCARAAPAAGVTSTCTSPWTRRSPSARRTRSPSTSPPTSATACPTRTCSCTSSRARSERVDGS